MLGYKTGGHNEFQSALQIASGKIGRAKTGRIQ